MHQTKQLGYYTLADSGVKQVMGKDWRGKIICFWISTLICILIINQSDANEVESIRRCICGTDYDSKWGPNIVASILINLDLRPFNPIILH